MKKTVKIARMSLHRETLRVLDARELQPVAAGYTGPDSHCTTLLTCPTRRSICVHC
jgi:hypothetical protein